MFLYLTAPPAKVRKKNFQILVRYTHENVVPTLAIFISLISPNSTKTYLQLSKNIKVYIASTIPPPPQ